MAAVVPGQDHPYQQHHQTQTQPTSQQNALHGKKRAADNGLESEQRLSKRFDLLNIDNGTRLYIPVSGSSYPAVASKHAIKSTQPTPSPMTQGKRLRKSRPPPDDDDDNMQVEDTPHRVYIHDLAAELSDLESDEETPIFLSDVEKHIAKIPKHVLMGSGTSSANDNALVLYQVPSSLSVPEERDSVRKAIVEARARVRERQAMPTAEPDRGNGTNTSRIGKLAVNEAIEAEYSDAMDID